ncbi:MAG: hypothetical protein ACI9BD_000250 [Candidatus Marinamargulisbacteria bacterium]|jgi:hypothetical protein
MVHNGKKWAVRLFQKQRGGNSSKKRVPPRVSPYQFYRFMGEIIWLASLGVGVVKDLIGTREDKKRKELKKWLPTTAKRALP